VAKGLSVLLLTAVFLPSALLARSTGAPVFSSGVPTAVDGNGQTCTRCHRTYELIRIELDT